MATEARPTVTLSEEILHTLFSPLLTADGPIQMTLLEKIQTLEKERTTLLLLIGELIGKNQRLRSATQA